jgi:putative membrane protein
MSLGSAFAKQAPGQPFLTKAIQGNLAEIEMGRLAQEKGQSDAVRSFGQQLVQDHGQANERATTAATAAGVTPPTEPSAKQRADAAKLAKLSGPAFDRQFASHMVMDHKKDVREYQAEAKKNDPASGYATETLPTLQKHLETAQSLTRAR